MARTNLERVKELPSLPKISDLPSFELADMPTGEVQPVALLVQDHHMPADWMACAERRGRSETDSQSMHIVNAHINHVK